MNPSTASVDESLCCIPFLDANKREKLKEELPSSLAEAADIDRDFDRLQSWKLHATTLPNWSAAAKKMILIQPSFAAAERVCSFLKRHLLENKRTWLYKTTLKHRLCFNTTSYDSSPCSCSLLYISYVVYNVVSWLNSHYYTFLSNVFENYWKFFWNNEMFLNNNWSILYISSAE